PRHSALPCRRRCSPAPTRSSNSRNVVHAPWCTCSGLLVALLGPQAMSGFAPLVGVKRTSIAIAELSSILCVHALDIHSAITRDRREREKRRKRLSRLPARERRGVTDGGDVGAIVAAALEHG